MQKKYKQAREEGRLAARAGETFVTNPYSMLSAERHEWFEGFHVGEAEFEAEMEQQNANG